MAETKAFLNYCKIIEEYSSNMDDYPYVYDLNNDLYYIVKRAKKRFHIKNNKFSHVPEGHKDFVFEEDLPMLTADLNAMVAGEKDRHDLEYRWLDTAGKPVWIHCRGSILKDPMGKPAFMIGCISEIGEQQLADNITGLRAFPSTKSYFDNLKVKDAVGSLLIIGVDGYESIISRIGLEYAQSLLRNISDIIQTCIPDGVEAYVEEPSTFILLNKAAHSFADANRVYERIRAKVDAYIEERHYEAVFTVSAGMVSLHYITNLSYNMVLQRATFALSMAIQRGKNQIYHFSQKDYEEFVHKKELLIDLNNAVSNEYEGFELYFQPIMDAKTGQLMAAESLCRFTRNGQMVSPVEFIPILEESGLIIPVGRWIIKNAIEMCQKVQKYIPGFKITVNLSYVQILKSPIKDRIIDALKASGLSPQSLVVELTESGYLENTPSVRNVWNKLKDMGIFIALDDFGTGYSNLDNINKLEPHLIKIDRGLTLKSLEDAYMKTLLDNIIRMSHSLGLKVCIEGIETEAELRAIRELGPDMIQGFYYGRPCCEADFLELFVS